jgi:transcriptional regulator with XRE-family HTH domain
MLDMHRPTISEIEAGNRSVSAEELARFAEVYGVGIEWLFGQEAPKLGSVDARLQPVLLELEKLKPRDIESLMRLLAKMREGSAAAGNRPTSAVEWTEQKNARRCELIDRRIQNTITAEEADELERLQQALRRHLDRVAPLPLEGATRLHAQLLRRQRRR